MWNSYLKHIVRTVLALWSKEVAIINKDLICTVTRKQDIFMIIYMYLRCMDAQGTHRQAQERETCT